MKSFKRLILSAALAMALPVAVFAAEPIVILHTNDVHCGVEDNLGLDKIAQYKIDLQRAGNNVLLVDAGDFVQGEALGTLTKGEALVRIMNKAGYDFAIPGNHEFDYSMKRFKELDALSDAGYYSCNIISLENNEHLLKPYKIFDFGDTQVALIGVTTPDTFTASTPAYFQNSKGEYIYSFCEDLSGQKLYKQIQQTVDKVRKEGADKVFLVGHLGLNGSQPQWTSAAVAGNTRGIDGIIDGHSHEQYAGSYVQNKKGQNVLLAQTGTKLQSVGKLTIDTKGNVKSELINSLNSYNIPVAATIALENSAFAKLLLQPIGRAEYSLYDRDPITKKRLVRNHETNLGNFVADAARAVYGTDIGIVNGGGLRATLPAGELLYGDILRALPFANKYMAIEITGQQLLDALEMSCFLYPQENGGFLSVSGISYTLDSSIPVGVQVDEKGNFVKVRGRYRVQDVLVGGEPLDVSKKYTIAGGAYVLNNGGDGMTMFKGCKILQPAQLTDIDVAVEYLQNHLNGQLDATYANPKGEGRITIK